METVQKVNNISSEPNTALVCADVEYCQQVSCIREKIFFFESLKMITNQRKEVVDKKKKQMENTLTTCNLHLVEEELFCSGNDDKPMFQEKEKDITKEEKCENYKSNLLIAGNKRPQVKELEYQNCKDDITSEGDCKDSLKINCSERLDLITKTQCIELVNMEEDSKSLMSDLNIDVSENQIPQNKNRMKKFTNMKFPKVIVCVISMIQRITVIGFKVLTKIGLKFLSRKS